MAAYQLAQGTRSRGRARVLNRAALTPFRALASSLPPPLLITKGSINYPRGGARDFWHANVSPAQMSSCPMASAVYARARAFRSFFVPEQTRMWWWLWWWYANAAVAFENLNWWMLDADRRERGKRVCYQARLRRVYILYRRAFKMQFFEHFSLFSLFCRFIFFNVIYANENFHVLENLSF